MSYLLDFYGDAIAQKHREILSQYYEEDLSLSEIAANFGISRQGARHLIKKGEEQLLFFEETLGLAKQHKDATRNYKELCELVSLLRREIEQAEDNEKMMQLLSGVTLSMQKLRLD